MEKQTIKSEYYYEKDRNLSVNSCVNPKMKMTKEELGLKNQNDRKKIPIYTGVLKYFPDAIKEIAKCSYAGQFQHNPNKPLHWDRKKSGDELDALTRHLMDAGTFDSDGVRHSAKVAWRALAYLQKELEKEIKNRNCKC
jgi:hypothetical protein